MKLAIYTKDDGGIITFRGVEELDSPHQLIQDCHQDDCEAEPTEMVGWPDAEVIWHGNTGYAIRENDHAQH
jgi:hypothetical protein